MKPAFVILFAVLLLVPSHTGLSREQAQPVGSAAAAQTTLQLGNPRHPGGQPTAREPKTSTITLLGNLPLYFIENRGQVDGQVKYSAKIRNGMAYFTNDGIVYEFLLRDENDDSPAGKPSPIVTKAWPTELSKGESPTFREETLRLKFVGANEDARVDGQEEQEAKFNYFRGNDPRKWVSGAPSYGNVIYRDLYPDIDLIVSGREGRMKEEYVVRAGGDPSVIRLKFEGAKSLRVTEKGQLEVQTSFGLLIEDVPLSYQIVDGKKKEVKTRYQITTDDTVQFRAAAYRTDTELIIDPLTYSTFLGGSALDYCRQIAVDGSGNAYVAGYTTSSDFPATAGAYDTSQNGAIDVFVAKLNPSGTALVYATFLGGTVNDVIFGLAIDGTGNAYVTGWTASSTFPTTAGAYDTSYNGNNDIFVVRLSSTGSELLYSTFLGGANWDSAYGIVADGSGNAYVVGFTQSSDFPTTSGSYDTSYNGAAYDAYVAKLNSSGSALIYSTFLGGSGSGYEATTGIAVDGSGNAYLAGYTASSDFPTTSGAYDTTANGGDDGFIAKLNSSGSALIYSTFLGGTANDLGLGIAVDGSGNAYTAGYTNASGFPTTSGAYDETWNGNDDVFVTKLNSSGSALVYSTYLGGAGSEDGFAMAIDGTGNAYVTGYTNSADFPATPGAFDTSFNGNDDVFITRLNSSGTALVYSTYLGGTANERGYGIATDGNWNSYVAGLTYSNDFPATSGAYDTSYNAGGDAFIIKLPSGYSDIRQPIAPIDFGNISVGSTSDRTTTIYNDGEAPLTVNSIIRTSGSSEFTFVDPSFPLSIPAAGSQDVTVRFLPSSAGAKSSVFTVTSDDQDEPNVTFDVSGTGVILTETVSTPGTPIGTTSGTIGTSYAFATGNSTSNLGHNVQYYFDWGDGTNTGWLAVGTFSAQKSWSSANTYNVTAKARCATDTAIESSLSSALAVNISAQGRDNSPSRYQVIPECIWAVATGGGTWVSEVQITDITGGSAVSVYFDYGGGGNRRGPFMLWTGPAANYNIKYANMLSTIDGLDGGVFDYYGRVGAVEFSTQDASHKIMVTARTLNGNYSKTFPGLNLTDSNTANTSRRMVLQNFVNNATYRSSCGFFNPTADSVTMELRLIAENGDTLGSAFTKTLVGHDFQSFSPFNQAGVPYPTYAYDNVVLWITPTSGSGKVMIYGATANNTSNDPAAHIGVQYQ